MPVGGHWMKLICLCVCVRASPWITPCGWARPPPPPSREPLSGLPVPTEFTSTRPEPSNVLTRHADMTGEFLLLLLMLMLLLLLQRALFLCRSQQRVDCERRPDVLLPRRDRHRLRRAGPPRPRLPPPGLRGSGDRTGLRNQEVGVSR